MRRREHLALLNEAKMAVGLIRDDLERHDVEQAMRPSVQWLTAADWFRGNIIVGRARRGGLITVAFISDDFDARGLRAENSAAFAAQELTALHNAGLPT